MRGQCPNLQVAVYVGSGVAVTVARYQTPAGIHKARGAASPMSLQLQTRNQD